jgi:hypothetical protein
MTCGKSVECEIYFSSLPFLHKERNNWVYEITILSAYMYLSKCPPFQHLTSKPTFTKHGMNIMPLKASPTPYSLISLNNDNMAGVQICEVGATVTALI